jgi:shikimate dehydrogenase
MAKAFIVGQPVKHSRSPLVHGHWLRQHGIEGSYERIEVAPDDFPDFLHSFARNGYAGGNVTIPHKEAAFAGVLRRTPRAERMKAVNTIWVENGEVWGDNTDMLGFVAHLDQTLGSGWDRSVSSALVLGAGGASRAVVAGLQERRIKTIRIANRTRAKAEEVMNDLGLDGSGLEAADWKDVNALVPESDLVVNTTSLGMSGQPPLDLDLSQAPASAIIADIVYVPLVTPLLAQAQNRGLRTVDGLGMLLHQAVPGFARWFGTVPEVTPELRELIAADVEGRR